MNRHRRAAALVAVLATMAAGCSSSSDQPAPPLNQATSASSTTADCDDIERTFVGRERPAPGGHVQLDVFAVTASGVVDGTDCFTVRDDATGARVEAAARIEATPRRILGVVVDPGRNEAERDRAVAVVDALAAAQPDAQLSVYRWGGVDDPLAAPAVLVDSDSTWVVAADAGAVGDNWRDTLFELSGGFVEVEPGSAWPEPVTPGEPVLGRLAFDLVQPEIHDAELVVEHTQQARIWLNGVEIGAGDAAIDTEAGVTRVRQTVDATTLRSGTNVLAVEMRGVDDGVDVVEASLVGTDGQAVPVAPVVPVGPAAALPGDLGQLVTPSTAPPGRLADALGSVVDDLEQTHDDETDALRALIVVAPNSPAPDVELDGRADAALVWIGDGDDPGDFDLAVDADDDLSRTATTVVEHLDEVAAGRLVIGICGNGTGFDAEVEVGVVNLTTTLKAPPPEAAAAPCDPGTVAAYSPDPIERVELVLDDISRPEWQQRVADKDKAPFAASFLLGPDWAPVPAEVSLRGQSSLECERKSYEVNLEGGHRRAIADEAAFDEFFLVSLCLDEGYVRTHTMLDLLAQQGLFPPAFRLVRLDIDDQPAGVYLLVEPPDEALRDGQPQLDGVVRRALDSSFQQSSTVWSAVDRDDVVFDSYEAVIETAEAGGADLVDRVSDDLDLDAYLRWLAIMSATDNGDYVDEVFFAGVSRIDGNELAPYWTPMGWDPDDIFSPCHFDDFQFVDPSGLSTCAEARIDHALLASEAGYAAYVDALARVLEQLPPDDFAAALTRTRDRLAEVVDDETAAAMPELAELSGADTSTAAGLLAAVDAEVDRLDGSYRERHALLSAGIDDSPILTVEPALEVTAPSRVLAGQRVPVLVRAGAADDVDRRVDGRAVEVSLGDAVEVLLGQGVAVAAVEAATATLSVDGDPVGDVEVVDQPDRTVTGSLATDQRWGPDAVVLVGGDVVVEPASTLTIEPGTTVVVAPGANIEVLGSLTATGTSTQPVVVADADPRAPWGGMRADGGSIDLDHTLVTGGGGDPSRAVGHSDSQPVVAAVSGGSVALRSSVIADSVGKALWIEGARLDVADSVITRTDTGGEVLEAAFAVTRSWFLDFPTADTTPVDDDNDAFYVGTTTEPSTITDSVFIGGRDDGIDHAGADLVIERVWIEGFDHECLATSEGGSVSVSESVLTGCEQGIEIGYGTPTV
ncbi:MAG: CotH kinase family protein, partial [Acidimicrobiia bacterium]|nr:CotH kinase family protein [Acidimicrobiia bacterium]